MTDKYDEETRLVMEGAAEDVQLYLANAGSQTTEKELMAWQLGYIAGAQRAMGIKNG